MKPDPEPIVRNATPLPADLTIYNVAALRVQWLALLDKSGKAAARQFGRFDASAVEQVDAAGLQLLVALSHSLAGRQRRLQIVAPSQALRSACEALGLTELLDDAHAGQGAAA